MKIVEYFLLVIWLNQCKVLSLFLKILKKIIVALTWVNNKSKIVIKNPGNVIRINDANTTIQG